MTYDQRLDERMVEWLEAGPNEVPVLALEAAVGYARSHRRRRLSATVAWRAVLARVAILRAPAATRRSSFSTVSAAAMVVLLLASMGGGAVLIGGALNGRGWGFAPPAASPAPTPSATPTSTPVPVPTLPVAVTGSWACATTTAPSSSVAGAVTQYRGAIQTCVSAMSDQRVSGQTTVHSSTDEQPDGSADTWGTVITTTPVGTWTGQWLGTVDAGSTIQHVEGVMVGLDGYEGLRYRFNRVVGTRDDRVTGSIEAVDTLPAGGAGIIVHSSCVAVDSGTTTIDGDVTRYRGVILRCEGIASDPRVAGPRQVTVDVDIRADESADLRGTFEITGPDGAWTGSWTGTVEIGYTTHRMEGTLDGSGGYAGLEFRFHQIGGERDQILIGTIEPAR